MKISVIIPVFNAESYLKRCLDSVLNQTLSDVEIICIDDCSTDNSCEILKSYAERDSRIKLWKNEKNIGQGLTRNKGLDVAVGEYVAFVDCDDWIEKDMYQVLYEKTLTAKYDLVCCNLVFDFPDGSKGVPKMPAKEKISQEFLINESINPSITFFSPNSPCDKIFRRQYIEKLNLRFKSERLYLYEDKLFNMVFLASNPFFYFEAKVFYHYVIRYGSTMTSYKKDLAQKYFLMNNDVKDILSKNDFLKSEQEYRLSKSLFDMTFVLCLNALVYNKSIKGKFYDFKELIKDKKVSSNAKKFKLKDIPRSSSIVNKVVKATFFLFLKYLK
ncbi:hypothetical protein ASE40_00675 [Flavobacterium sp. Root935]|uniref:glycosyltransferase family 2 protein n=1 Tax=Flavobacterium sp. Root935 TaxID=1736610 RepID=UPI00070D8E84|nr:glycosyltransferase family 2 protein [Flavobacterium sp. Root935]KRD63896.1 hypothetical protein ASE40_00675 [Flavobacterium sp. Root935]